MMQGWNTAGETRVRLKRRVSAAVLVIDDFTGKPILSDDVQVKAEQLLERPIRKGDGYFLFLDCPVPALDLTITAWAYHPAKLRVELAQLPAARPVVRVRLTPNRNYSIPSKTTCLEGVAPPDAQLRVFCQNDPRPLRLIYDYSPGGDQGGCTIHLYDPAEGDLGGQSFVLLRKDDPDPEFFTVREALDEGEQLLAAPLRDECKKAGATVLPVYTAQADGQGRFFLPLKRLPVRSYQCRVFWADPGGDWQERTLELTPGGVTRLELLQDK